MSEMVQWIVCWLLGALALGLILWKFLPRRGRASACGGCDKCAAVGDMLKQLSEGTEQPARRA